MIELSAARSLTTAFIAILLVALLMPLQAFADEFNVEAIPTVLTGVQEKHVEGKTEVNDRYSFASGIFECSTTSYGASIVQSKSSSLALSPSISGCFYSLANIDVDSNGCYYVLNLSKTSTTGTTDISCPAGKEIVWTFTLGGTSKGSIHFPPQVGKGGVTYTNIGSGSTREITVAVKITDLAYSQEAGTGIGRLEVVKFTETGTYVGGLRLMGESSGGTHIGIFLA